MSRREAAFMGADPARTQTDPTTFTIPLTPYKTILHEAGDLVFGPREKSYAHPSVDAARFVGLLNALYADKLKQPFEPIDYGLIMLLVKIGRTRASVQRDTILDIAGYAEVIARTVGIDP